MRRNYLFFLITLLFLVLTQAITFTVYKTGIAYIPAHIYIVKSIFECLYIALCIFVVVTGPTNTIKLFSSIMVSAPISYFCEGILYGHVKDYIVMHLPLDILIIANPADFIMWASSIPLIVSIVASISKGKASYVVAK